MGNCKIEEVLLSAVVYAIYVVALSCREQDLPINTPNGHISLEEQTELNSNCNEPEVVIVDMNVVMNTAVPQYQAQQQLRQQHLHPAPSTPPPPLQ